MRNVVMLLTGALFCLGCALMWNLCVTWWQIMLMCLYLLIFGFLSAVSGASA